MWSAAASTGKQSTDDDQRNTSSKRDSVGQPWIDVQFNGVSLFKGTLVQYAKAPSDPSLVEGEAVPFECDEVSQQVHQQRNLAFDIAIPGAGERAVVEEEEGLGDWMEGVEIEDDMVSENSAPV
eukprot:scaffold940_cov569-Prasinococcus_capsulatus_cf.AAC.7